jgi:hypothetical protein
MWSQGEFLIENDQDGSGKSTWYSLSTSPVWIGHCLNPCRLHFLKKPIHCNWTNRGIPASLASKHHLVPTRLRFRPSRWKTEHTTAFCQKRKNKVELSCTPDRVSNSHTWGDISGHLSSSLCFHLHCPAYTPYLSSGSWAKWQALTLSVNLILDLTLLLQL